MASIICKVSAQFTQNVFLRLDEHKRGYLDLPMLERALVGLSHHEVRQLLLTLDQDEDQRISPHELHLAILDWLSESGNIPIPTSLASLIVLYGLEGDGPSLQAVAETRRYTASDHLYARTGYAR